MNIEKYLEPISVYSLAEEFGPFYCERAHLLNFMRGIFFLGFFCAITADSVIDG